MQSRPSWVQKIVEILRRIDPDGILTLAATAEQLNLAGLKTRRGHSWTPKAAERPVRKARQALQLEKELDDDLMDDFE